MIDIETLKAFEAVAETGSFSEAARRLYLTQPAVSKRIARLENELGRTLFDRVANNTILTESGRNLQKHSRIILSSINNLKVELDNMDNEIRGILNMGTSHHIGLHRLPPILSSFITRYPDVELNLRFLASETAAGLVQDGTLELALITLPSEIPGPLQAWPIWTDQLVFAAAPNHPLAESGRVSLADLSRYPAVLPETGTITRDISETIFRQQQLSINVRLATNYLETLKMMVQVGLGWSLLPDSMFDHRFVRIEIPGIRPARTLGLIAHRERTASNAACALIGLLAAASDFPASEFWQQ